MAWGSSTNPWAIGDPTSIDRLATTFDNSTHNRNSVGDFTQVIIGTGVTTIAITHADDTNTGISFPAADTIVIETGGIEALRVNSNQSTILAGILSVNDITDSTSTTTGSIHTDGGIGVAKDVIIGTGLVVGGVPTWSTALIVSITDNSTAYSTANFLADLATTNLMVANRNATARFCSIGFQNKVSSASIANISFEHKSNNNGDLAFLFRSGASSSTEVARMKSSGFFGIGIDPVVGLHVNTNAVIGGVATWATAKLISISDNSTALAGTTVLPDIAETNLMVANRNPSADFCAIGFQNRTSSVSGGYIALKHASSSTGDFVFNLRSSGTGQEVLRLKGNGDMQVPNGIIFINDTANAKMTIGLTINQGTNKDEILALKASDVAHGITDFGETDTFAVFKQTSLNVNGGGLSIIPLKGPGGNPVGLVLEPIIDDIADVTKSTIGLGVIIANSRLKSGTGKTNVGANGNLMVIRNNDVTRFIFDADGDSHQDVGTLWTNFDDEEDALAVRGLMETLERDSAKKQLMGMCKYNAKRLHNMGVITWTPKEKTSHKKHDDIFLSSKGVLGLYGGAIGELQGVLDLALKASGTSYEKLRKKFRASQPKLSN